MVLGRRELGAILLGVAAIAFYLVLLSTSPSGAQTGGGTTNRTTNQYDNDDDGDNLSDEGCDNPEIVDTFSGSNSQITPAFEITGNTFQLTLEAEPIDSEEFASIFIESFEEDGTFVSFGNIEVNPLEEPVTETANVLEGPGSFTLEIEANNAQYDITVEDCTGDGGETTQARTTSDRTTRDRTTRPGGRTVINVPNKPLPPSGGLPVYGVTAGFVLTGAGLLALGLVIRRGTRG